MILIYIDIRLLQMYVYLSKSLKMLFFRNAICCTVWIILTNLPPVSSIQESGLQSIVGNQRNIKRNDSTENSSAVAKLLLG